MSIKEELSIMKDLFVTIGRACRTWFTGGNISDGVNINMDFQPTRPKMPPAAPPRNPGHSRLGLKPLRPGHVHFTYEGNIDDLRAMILKRGSDVFTRGSSLGLEDFYAQSSDVKEDAMPNAEELAAAIAKMAEQMDADGLERAVKVVMQRSDFEEKVPSFTEQSKPTARQATDCNTGDFDVCNCDMCKLRRGRIVEDTLISLGRAVTDLEYGDIVTPAKFSLLCEYTRAIMDGHVK